MRYFIAVPLTFFLLYLASSVLHVIARPAQDRREFGEALVGALLSLMVWFAIGLLVALVLTGLISVMSRRDRWWIGSAVTVLVLMAPTALLLLFGSLPESERWGACESVIAGQLTHCGVELYARSLGEAALWWIGGGVLYAVVWRIIGRERPVGLAGATEP